MLSTIFNFIENKYLHNDIIEIENVVKTTIEKSFPNYLIEYKSIDYLPNNNQLLTDIQTELVFPIKFSYIDNNLYECKVFYNDIILTRVMFKINLVNIFKTLPLETFKAILNYFGNTFNQSDNNYYHTINHIQRMLIELDKQIQLTDLQYRLLYSTIIFHDANYQAGKDNECEAIKLAKKYLFLNNYIEFNDFNKIEELIDSTRIGTSIDRIKEVYLGDLLHDFDYIGFSDDNYLNNTEKIYNECYHLVVNRKQFNENRIKFLIMLRNSLKDNKLYLHKNYQMYNNIALKHINNEIMELNKYE